LNPFTFLRVAGRLKRMRQHDRWTRDELRAYQLHQQRRVRTHAYARSPFYRDFHQGSYDAPLSELPPLSKMRMMEKYDEFVTDRAIQVGDVQRHLLDLKGDGRFQRRYRLTATSGTTGQPGLFLYDTDEWLWIMASFWRAQELSGRHVDLRRRAKMASLGAIAPYYMTTRVAASLHSWWTPEVRLDVTEDFRRLAGALGSWQPEVLASYPSVVAKLAAEQIAGRLNIAPQRIFTGGEPLFPEWRSQLEAAWGRCVYDLYAATEVGAVAAECEEHRLHLMEDLFIPEVVDADDCPVPDGATGDKLLVTMFHRKTQPLIRYELSDCLVISPEPCPCGRPFRVIDRIQGKAEHLIPLAARDGGTVSLHVFIVADVMDRVPVRGWQVQAENGQLRLLLVGLRDDYDQTSISLALNRAFVAQGAAETAIDIQRVDEIPRGPSGKVVPVIIKKGPP